MAAGTYYVREVVPDGFVRTAPATSDNYKVVLAAGGSSTGNDFANAERCDASTVTNVSFKVVHSDGTSCTVTSLAGNTRQGDVIKVTFTVNDADHIREEVSSFLCRLSGDTEGLSLPITAGTTPTGLNNSLAQ